MQLAFPLLGRIISLGEIHSPTKCRLHLFHLLPDRFRKGYLVGISICKDVQIDGIQAIYPVISVGGTVLVLIGGQVVEINSLVTYHPYRHLLQRFAKLIRGEIYGASFRITRLLILTHHIGSAQKGAYTTLHIMNSEPITG